MRACHVFGYDCKKEEGRKEELKKLLKQGAHRMQACHVFGYDRKKEEGSKEELKKLLKQGAHRMRACHVGMIAKRKREEKEELNKFLKQGAHPYAGLPCMCLGKIAKRKKGKKYVSFFCVANALCV